MMYLRKLTSASWLLGTLYVFSACASDASGGVPGGSSAPGSGGTGAQFASGGVNASGGGAPPPLGTGGSATSGGTGGTTEDVTGGSPADGGRPSGGNGGSAASGGTAGTSTGAGTGVGGVGGQSGGGSSGGAATGGTSSGPATDPITIWLAGDSTVANGNTPCPVGWGKAFENEFNDRVTVANSAAGGRSVRTWLYSVTTTMGTDKECVIEEDAAGDRVEQARFTTMKADMNAGDYLFVQFGINDGSATCDRHVGLAAFKEEYALLAQVAWDRGAHPIFVTPVSAIACGGTTAVGTRGEFVTATLEIGTTLSVPVIDLHQLSVDFYNASAFCPVPGGDVSASTTGPVGDFFCDDHTHFSTSGAASIGSLIAQAIKDQSLPLAAYLR